MLNNNDFAQIILITKNKKKMKTLKKLSMLFLMSALCLGFVNCSDKNDNDPIDPERQPEVDYSKTIPGHWANTVSAETIGINYNGVGTIALQYMADNDWSVSAYGTYTLSGSILTANYTRVEVLDANWNPTTFYGFTDGKSRTVKYTIVSCDGKKLAIKDESGKTLNYEKYAEVKQ